MYHIVHLSTTEHFNLRLKKGTFKVLHSVQNINYQQYSHYPQGF